jgi:hypothetical protein
MTQLIENKPPRRALIATLSHFSPHQAPASSLQHQEPNRQIPELETHLIPAESMYAPLIIANFARFAIHESCVTTSARSSVRLPAVHSKPTFLIDRGSRLEIGLTSAESTLSKFLIVAESRFRHSDFRAENLAFDRAASALRSLAAPAHESCSGPLDKIGLHSPRPGGGMAYAEDLKSVRATLRGVKQHSAPKHSTAKIASVHAASASFASRRIHAVPRTAAKVNEKPTDTPTDTGDLGCFPAFQAY